MARAQQRTEPDLTESTTGANKQDAPALKPMRGAAALSSWIDLPVAPGNEQWMAGSGKFTNEEGKAR
jgi:hypothetical protein